MTCSIEGCNRPVKYPLRGLCNTCYERLRRRGELAARARPTVEERFWAKVNRDGPLPDFAPHLGPCYLWVGAADPNGYGNFKVRSYVTVPAYRFAYELANGSIPTGLHIDHLCRVPQCVRIEHLEAVTCAENVRRGARGQLVTRCPKGHPYDAENTRWDKHGHRDCRACDREYQREKYRSLVAQRRQIGL